MKKYKILKNIFIVLALMLSHFMCADVAYNYAAMVCGIKHMGFSAPADVAFLFAIPYAIAVVICAVMALIFSKKEKRIRERYE